MTEDALRLRPVTAAEFAGWMPRQLAGYVALIVSSGAMPAAAARRKAEADTARMFPDGFGSPGQLLFRVMAGETTAGWLWLSVPSPDDPLMAWVYDVEIDAAFRGRGYGRAAMVLAEEEARNRGMASLGLNVHGQNTVARSLYESLGYETTSLQMKKALHDDRSHIR